MYTMFKTHKIQVFFLSERGLFTILFCEEASLHLRTFTYNVNALFKFIYFLFFWFFFGFLCPLVTHSIDNFEPRTFIRPHRHYKQLTRSLSRNSTKSQPFLHLIFYMWTCLNHAAQGLYKKKQARPCGSSMIANWVTGCLITPMHTTGNS